MQSTKTLILNKTKTEILTFSTLLILSVALPLFFHQQWLTGSLVNCLLIITALRFGLSGGISLSIIPSLVALAGGLLPVALAPAVPFIIMSNIILVIAIRALTKRNYYLAILLGATAKFLFLYSAVNLILINYLQSPFFNAVSVMLSWPQFVTALCGGLLAWIILKGFKIPIH